MFEIQSTRDGRLSRQEQAIEGEIVGRPAMPRPVEKALTTAVAKQYARYILGVTRVQTTARVADEVLYSLDKLEAEEAAAVARDQFNAGRRQRRIVDAFAAVGEDAIRTTGKAYG